MAADPSQEESKKEQSKGKREEKASENDNTALKDIPFEDLLESNNLIFSPSVQMKSVKPMANPHALYQGCFAPIEEDKKALFQVRYSIYPNMGGGAQFGHMFLSTFVCNISQNMNAQQVLNSIKSFPAQSVKDEFNADYGFTTMCDIDHKWSEVFNKALINAIGVDDGSFVVISIIFKKELLQDNVKFQNTIM
eukprot:800395_1